MCRGQATEEYKAAEKKREKPDPECKKGNLKKADRGQWWKQLKRPFFAYVNKKTNSRPSVGR
jgi:hypothetical protein